MNKKTTILISKLAKVPGSFNRYQTSQPLKDANLECLKKSPQEPGDFQNMFQIKPKTHCYFCHSILYPISGLSCTALLPFGK